MINKIKIFIDNNEKGSVRCNDLLTAALGDARFMQPEFAEIETDVRFVLRDEDPIGGDLCNISEAHFNVE